MTKKKAHQPWDWSTKKNKLLPLLLLGGLFVAFSFYREAHDHGSICLIYNTTGIPCPSCGMTRSYLALLSFNFQQAFFFHPFFFLVPFLFYALYKNHTKMLYVLGGLFILLWIIRMILYFPHTAPMNYNPHSLWGFIMNLLRKVFS